MCDAPPDYSPGDATPLAPTAGPPPPSPTTVHSSPALPSGSVPAPDAALTTPPWLLGPDTPVPPACPSANACPVCVCGVHTVSTLVDEARNCPIFGPLASTVCTVCTLAVWPAWLPTCTPCVAHLAGNSGRRRRREHGVAQHWSTALVGQPPANTRPTPAS